LISKVISPLANSTQGDFKKNEPFVELIAPERAEKFPFRHYPKKCVN
jgi:hypothetical protein